MTKAPNSVTIIWATEGAQDTFIERCISEQNFLNQATLGQRSSLIEEKSRAAEISWCFESRANLGPQGWDRWISGDIHCERVEGNHFSVVMQPQGRGTNGPDIVPCSGTSKGSLLNTVLRQDPSAQCLTPSVVQTGPGSCGREENILQKFGIGWLGSDAQNEVVVQTSAHLHIVADNGSNAKTPPWSSENKAEEKLFVYLALRDQTHDSVGSPPNKNSNPSSVPKYFPDSKLSSIRLALAQTCQQLRAEALPIYDSRNTFDLGGPRTLAKYLEATGQTRRSLIKRMSCYISTVHTPTQTAKAAKLMYQCFSLETFEIELSEPWRDGYLQKYMHKMRLSAFEDLRGLREVKITLSPEYECTEAWQEGFDIVKENLMRTVCKDRMLEDQLSLKMLPRIRLLRDSGWPADGQRP